MTKESKVYSDRDYCVEHYKMTTDLGLATSPEEKAAYFSNEALEYSIRLNWNEYWTYICKRELENRMERILLDLDDK